MYKDTTLFDILQFSGPKFNIQTLRSNRRKLQRILHPDKLHAEKLVANKLASIINQAYEVLSNKKKHLEYYRYGRKQQTYEFIMAWDEIDFCLSYYNENNIWINNKENIIYPNYPCFDEDPDSDIEVIYEKTPHDDKEQSNQTQSDDTNNNERSRNDSDNENNTNNSDHHQSPGPSTTDTESEDKHNTRDNSETPESEQHTDSEFEPKPSQQGQTKRRSYMHKIKQILDHRKRKDRGGKLQFKTKWHGPNIHPEWVDATLLASEFPEDLLGYISSLSNRRQRPLIKGNRIIEDLIGKLNQ